MITAPQIITYERPYRDAALNLMFYARRTHTHLDWYRASTWLDFENPYIRLAYDHQALMGLIGISQPLYDTAWIRLAGVHHGYDAGLILSSIWEPLRADLKAAGVRSVAVLVINSWLLDYLPGLGFAFDEDVVTLYRTGTFVPPLPAHNLVIRGGYIEDLRKITAVDHSAFAPPWQMLPRDLRQAQRQAASSTVAELDGEIIGYQISTRHHTSGHLARLAVMPEMQGKRVGAALLDALIHNFNQRGVRSMTVNTQASNTRSQRLYMRYGFQRNGFDLPIWKMDL